MSPLRLSGVSKTIIIPSISSSRQTIELVMYGPDIHTLPRLYQRASYSPIKYIICATSYLTFVSNLFTS